MHWRLISRNYPPTNTKVNQSMFSSIWSRFPVSRIWIPAASFVRLNSANVAHFRSRPVTAHVLFWLSSVLLVICQRAQLSNFIPTIHWGLFGPAALSSGLWQDYRIASQSFNTAVIARGYGNKDHVLIKWLLSTSRC